MTQARMRQALLRACNEMNPDGVFPLDLDTVLAAQGIRYRFERANGRTGAAYLEVGSHPLITIVKNNECDNNLSPRDRFSVAHELAHWVLWKYLSIPPAATAPEYWQHEDLCNRFAQHLLVPIHSLKQYIIAQCADLPPVAYPHAVARAANVTWQAAARAVSTISLFDLAYLRLKPLLVDKDYRITIQSNPTREPLDVSDSTNNIISVFGVEHSSLSFKPGSFVGQQSRIHSVDLHENLTRMQKIKEAGAGSVYRTVLTFTFGAVSLRNVSCLVMPRKASYIICFRRSDSGIRMKRMPETLFPVSPDGRAYTPEEENRNSWYKRETWFGSLPPQKPLLRTVQKLAIDALRHRTSFPESDFNLMLARQFAKIDVKHLTEAEANVVIKQLEQIRGRTQRYLK